MSDVPKITLSLTPTERRRLDRLVEIQGGTSGRYSRVVADAVVHALATIESGGQLLGSVPSEIEALRRQQQEKGEE